MPRTGLPVGVQPIACLNTIFRTRVNEFRSTSCGKRRAKLTVVVLLCTLEAIGQLISLLLFEVDGDVLAKRALALSLRRSSSLQEHAALRCLVARYPEPFLTRMPSRRPRDSKLALRQRCTQTPDSLEREPRLAPLEGRP
jgi:hypothetical protein